MKRIFALIMALSLLVCFTGCGNGTQDGTTTAVSTTAGPDVNGNKATLAMIGFDELVTYLNLCAAYGVPLDVGADATVGEIADILRAEGSVIDINNVNENAKFFDYAMVNPDNANGTNYYILKEDADWPAIYVD